LNRTKLNKAITTAPSQLCAKSFPEKRLTVSDVFCQSFQLPLRVQKLRAFEMPHNLKSAYCGKLPRVQKSIMFPTELSARIEEMRGTTNRSEFVSNLLIEYFKLVGNPVGIEPPILSKRARRYRAAKARKAQ